MRADVAFEKEAERKSKMPRVTAARKKIPWFRVDVNLSKKVRFLWEMGDGIGLYRHQREQKPFSVSCFKNEDYGQDDCPYCAEGAPNKMEYFWLVYNYSDQEVQILNFRDTSFTPVALLRALNDDAGTITDRDISIKRVPAQSPRNDGRAASQYLAIWGSPSDFTIVGIEEPTHDEVLAYLKPFELRD